MYLPIRTDWRLNERHYGALQGLNKKETAEQHGAEQVLAWRRGYSVRPPALAADDASRPDADPRYAGISGLPDSESLADTLLRVTEWWDGTLVPLLMSDSRLLIVAHGNSLRAMVKFLDQMSEDEILEFNIPTGIPMVYEFEDNLSVIRRYYLADDNKLQSAVDEVRNQASTKES
jgi:2,3-bisphosphoglycerate-dependent phosphoglycerate mutase